MKVLLLAASLIVYTDAFCINAYGAIGEYSADCPDSAGKYCNKIYYAIINFELSI